MAIPAKPTLTTPPTAPVRGEDRVSFAIKANAYVAFIGTNVTDLTAAIDWQNTVFTAVDNAADATLINADRAEAAAAVASAGVNFRGKWSDASGSASGGGSYEYEGGLWLLLSDVTNIAANEPAQGALWIEVTVYTDSEVDALLGFKADKATTYTETEVDSLLDAKANTSGQVFTGEITYYGAGGEPTNTSYGTSSLENNTTGDQVVALGRAAFKKNTTGIGGTAVGNFNLADVTEGDRNTGLGHNSGRGIVTGSGNTVIGTEVIGLASDLENNLILASGEVVRYRYNGTETTIGGPLVITGAVSGSNLSGTNTGDGALAIGVGQTWQDVTGSRAQNTNYTNSTGKPIFIYIALDEGTKDLSAITVDGVGVGAEATYNMRPNQFIVPNGSVYRVDNATIFIWTELR